MHKPHDCSLAPWALSISLACAVALVSGAQEKPYAVVDTGQVKCYGETSEITCPSAGQPFYGQDSQIAGNAPSFTLSADGLTVTDNTTGLTWQRSPETNGDGVLDSGDKLTWEQAQARPAALNAGNFGGYGDWRLPTIKELYSLIDFRGTDPRVQGTDTSGLIPFLDTQYFEFVYGDPGAGERIIDAQYWSATPYVSTTMDGTPTEFGVNFADGRIKGYPRDTGPGGSPFKEFLRCVRGNPDYGTNRFSDNGDGTLTDAATGLMWAKGDSGMGLDWQDALAWVQTKNAEPFLGHADWRLPNAKELQGLLDYTRSPDTTGSAAIDPLFSATQIAGEDCSTDYPWYWSSTTHVSSDGSGRSGVYVCFGRAWGYMNGTWMDVHGAGAQRSDPKAGDLGSYSHAGCGYYNGIAPQGDAVRIGNYVRLVRDSGGGSAPLSAGFSFSPEAPTDATAITFTVSASGGSPPYTFCWDLCGTPESGESVTRLIPPGDCSATLTVSDSAGGSTSVTKSLTVGHSIAVTAARWLANPGRLKVWGTGFDSTCHVAIGGAAAPESACKGPTLLFAKGSGLKAMLPKGVAVQVTVVSADGRESAPFTFAR